MKFFMYFMLVCCVVRCDDTSNNYYIVEVPNNDPPKTFNVYWNVPTMQCKSKNVLFENLYEKYGIIQNKDDNFRGEKITILYEPGLFPAIFKNESSGKYKLRNGGVPQEGDLQEHLQVFRKDIDEIIPDENFSGVGIIDFESWRPIFRQNFGTLVPYKDLSYEIESKLHPWWPTAWVQSEAKRRFEESARKFMQTTIAVAKQMRPKAIWGYYGFPHCFNMGQNNLVEQCSSDVTKENDQTYWLWGESTALLPSIYRAHDLSASQLAAMVRGRVGEAARVRRRKNPILPYFWFRYRDGGFITEGDLSAIFNALYKSDASGFVIWGSSNDVNTLEKCVKLQSYVEKIFGPAVASYTKKSNKQEDEMVETTSGPYNFNESNYTTASSDDKVSTAKINSSDINESTPNYYMLKDKMDPEMVWDPPTNNSEDISSNIEEQLIKTSNSETDPSKIDRKNYNQSIIMDILMGTLITLRHIPHTNVPKDQDNITIQNNNFTNLVDVLKTQPSRVESDIKTENPIGIEVYTKNINSGDREQYYSDEDSTLSYKKLSEINETSYTNEMYTTDNINLYTSIESIETKMSNYSDIVQGVSFEGEAFKDISSETTSTDKLKIIDDINKDNEDLIYLENDKIIIDKSTQKTASINGDNTSAATDSSTKDYVDITTDKLLENEFYTEKDTFTTIDQI